MVFAAPKALAGRAERARGGAARGARPARRVGPGDRPRRVASQQAGAARRSRSASSAALRQVMHKEHERVVRQLREEHTKQLAGVQEEKEALKLLLQICHVYNKPLFKATFVLQLVCDIAIGTDQVK